MSSFDSLVIKTNNIMFLWKKTRGFAPTKTADKLDNAMLELHCEMTRTLKIWIDKGLSMTNGELVLARANIGAVVESWLKFFYCVYYNFWNQLDYSYQLWVYNGNIDTYQFILENYLNHYSTTNNTNNLQIGE